MLTTRAPRLARAAILAACAALSASACGDDPVSPPKPALVAPVVGTTPQFAKVNTVVAATPTVRVTDARGNTIAGVEVRFATGPESGTITGAVDTTDAQGLASVGSWQLGVKAQAQTLTATVEGIAPATFTATGTPDVATQITKVAATDAQTATVGTAVPTPPAVVVRDQYGNPVGGVTVTFQAFEFGSQVTGGTVVSNPTTGTATVGSWRLGSMAGTQNLFVTAPGLPPVTITATATAGALTGFALSPPLSRLSINEQQQLLIVEATDQYGNPVSTQPQATYQSNNEAVATVNASGLVTARALGTATITATVGTISRTATVTVANITSRSLGSRPFGVAISPAGVTYVSRLDAARLQRFDLPSTQLGASVTVENGPVGVIFSPDGNTAYVANQSSNSLGFVDVATNTQVATTAMAGSPLGLAVSADGSVVYVGNGSGSVQVVNASTRAVVATIGLSGAINAIARHPSQPLIYASSFNSGAVWEINTTTNTVSRTFNTGGMPQGLVVAPDGSELYIANESGALLVWNLTTGALGTSISGASSGFGIAMTPDGSQLYVTRPGFVGSGGVVYVVNRVARTVADTIPFPGGSPRRVAINPAGTLVVVADEAGSVHFIQR